MKAIKKSHSKRARKYLHYIIVFLIISIFLFPVVYLIACSFLSDRQVHKVLDFSGTDYKHIELIPEMFSLKQYYRVFFRSPECLRKFWNSVIVTFPAVIIQVCVSSLAAFVFAKLRFPMRDKLFFLYVILLLIPVQVTLVPDFLIFGKLHLLGSFLSVILPGAFSALGVCLLRQSIGYISTSSIEAARVDGASYIRIFWSIILPQTKGSIITLTLLTFLDCWNNIEQPLVFLSGHDKMPLAVGLNGSDIFACGVMFAAPPFLIYLYGHKDFSGIFMSVDK